MRRQRAAALWGRPGLSRRGMQLGLGGLWLFAGLLKFQPALRHAGFVRTVISPNAQGQPEPLSWLITQTARVLMHGQAGWVTVFGVIEMAIGLGLCFRRTVKPALLVSFVWAVCIWVFGEGLGGVLTGQVSPLMGAPGASFLYGIVGALAWPTEPRDGSEPASGIASSAIGSDRFGIRGGLGVWSALWFGEAILWLLPFNRAAGSVRAQLTGMANGEPSWYAQSLRALGHLVGGGGRLSPWRSPRSRW